MDNRAVDKRPNVNETMEKRKLAHYNNPNVIARIGPAPSHPHLVVPDAPPPQQLEDVDDASNANIDSKRSLRISQPPFSIVKKEVGSSSQKPRAAQEGVPGYGLASDGSAEPPQSEDNYNSFFQRSFHSLTKSFHSNYQRLTAGVNTIATPHQNRSSDQALEK